MDSSPNISVRGGLAACGVIHHLLLLNEENFAVTTEAFGNEYALAINHHDFYQIKTATALPATIWLVRHDVVDWAIILPFCKVHKRLPPIINEEFITMPRNKIHLRCEAFWRLDRAPIQR